MPNELHTGLKIKDYAYSPYKRSYGDRRALAKVYYSLLSVYNNLQLTNGELNLMAHLSSYGGQVSGTAKLDYLTRYSTTMATLDNTIGRLKKKKLLVKAEGKIRVNPKAGAPDFINNDKFIFSFKCSLADDRG